LNNFEAAALYNLGVDTLDYGALNAQKLFDVYATGTPAVVGGQTWYKVESGLMGDPMVILGGEEGHWSGVSMLIPPPGDTWIGAEDTKWSNPHNWISSVVPVNPLFNDTAAGLTADISVADVSPGSLVFNNSSKNFTVTGSKGIIGTTGLWKQGSGKVTLSSVNRYTGVTTVDGTGGTLQLDGVTKAQYPVISGGGANIKAGKMIFDYTGESSPATTIKGLLTTSYHAGAWNTGQFKSTTATANRGLGWIDNTTAKQVTVAYTLYGDATVNGGVDLSDLAALGQSWNGTGKVWAQGDFNYDGKVDLSDLAALGAHWNQSIAGFSMALDSTAAVPEPGAFALLGIAVIGPLAYAWRRRKRTV
jgi:autotransporter-associated beta strand protein